MSETPTKAPISEKLRKLLQEDGKRWAETIARADAASIVFLEEMRKDLVASGRIKPDPTKE